ncbi:hypothetical protein PLIIFM63780_004741 [Purpureocillium lilacinum]|uniref:Uncharacterized protein n=1 Tax=Purpureocillium lilacinum TaxID=33203 RepID=A0ACC4DFH2_PURLI|nr:hypothetical protein PLICBS_001324 [Purpureocillium lilacinum]GJN81209.1 hypothetical protein PLIIFM63780_004741 [Purpureocillium lilacinum]
MSVPSPTPTEDEDGSAGFALSFVTTGTETHLLVSDTFDPEALNQFAGNLSDRTQKTVQVFHDLVNHKFRLCPTSHEDILDLGEDVVFCFELDPLTEPVPVPRDSKTIYFAHYSAELRRTDPHLDEDDIELQVATMWDSEPEEEKEFWELCAWEERCDYRLGILEYD